MASNIKTTPRTRCLARRTGTTDGHLTFGDKKHNFYTEERCSRLTCLESNTLCSVCYRNSALSKSGYAGLMTQPIPKISHIYGGEWYKTKVLLWGEPSAAHLALAKEFQRVALVATPAPLVAVPPVKKRVMKIVKQDPVYCEHCNSSVDFLAACDCEGAKAEFGSDNDSVAEPLVAVPPVKTRVFKVAKQATPISDAAARFLTGRRRRERDPLVIQPRSIEPLAIESTDAPIREGDIDEKGNEITFTTLKLKKIFCDLLGREIYADENRENAYEIADDGLPDLRREITSDSF